MNHDILILVFLLATIPPMFLLMWWSKSKIGWTKKQRDEFWKRRSEVKENRLIMMLPHSVQLWRNLLESIRDNKPEGEKMKCAKEVVDYIKLMVE